MSVRDGETISYNPERFSEAINLARNANTNASSIKQATTKLKSVSTPSKPSIGTNISASVSDIETYIETLSNVEKTLIAMKNAAENTVNEGNALFKDLPELVEFKRIEVDQNGVKGYLYFPKDRDSFEGLPLITYLGGATSNKELNSINNCPLGKVINSGYSIDSAIFIPTNTWSGYVDRHGSRKDENLYNQICNIVDTYNLDRDRVSLIGHSAGAYEGYRLVGYANNQQDGLKFSAFVTTGSALKDPKGEVGELKSLLGLKTYNLNGSKTIFINCMQTGDTPLEHNYLVEKGLYSIGYLFNNADKNWDWKTIHNFIGTHIFSNQLLQDLVTIRYDDSTGLNSDLFGTCTTITSSDMSRVSLLNEETGTQLGTEEIKLKPYYQRISSYIDNENNNLVDL